jgi:hypothetical protein
MAADLISFIRYFVFHSRRDSIDSSSRTLETAEVAARAASRCSGSRRESR